MEIRFSVTETIIIFSFKDDKTKIKRVGGGVGGGEGRGRGDKSRVFT